MPLITELTILAIIAGAFALGIVILLNRHDNQ